MYSLFYAAIVYLSLVIKTSAFYCNIDLQDEFKSQIDKINDHLKINTKDESFDGMGLEIQSVFFGSSIDDVRYQYAQYNRLYPNKTENVNGAQITPKPETIQKIENDILTAINKRQEVDVENQTTIINDHVPITPYSGQVHLNDHIPTRLGANGIEAGCQSGAITGYRYRCAGNDGNPVYTATAQKAALGYRACSFASAVLVYGVGSGAVGFVVGSLGCYVYEGSVLRSYACGALISVSYGGAAGAAGLYAPGFCSSVVNFDTAACNNQPGSVIIDICSEVSKTYVEQLEISAEPACGPSTNGVKESCSTVAN